MKHNVKITLILIGIFFFSQIIGLAILHSYCSPEPVVCNSNLPLGMLRPEISDIAPTMQPVVDTALPFVENEEAKESTSVSLYFIVLILIGTGLLLILIKLRGKRLSKLWFTFAIFVGITLGLGAFIPHTLATIIGLAIAIWKVYYPNVYVNNFAEVFVYGGIASMFYLLLNVFSASLLLIGISIYDMIAVWKIKHMITLAKFQTENNMFAGAMIPYSSKKKKVSIKVKPAKQKSKGKKQVSSSVKTAVLGGGDMAFPLLFTGAILKGMGIIPALIIIICSTIALALLFYNAQKDKFYPAMPFISAGCFVGLGLVFLLF